MTAAWMLYVLLTTGALALAALAVERICRMHGRRSRWVWPVAMIAPLLLALAPADSPPPPASTMDSALRVQRAPAPLAPSAPIAEVFEGVVRSPTAARFDAALLTLWCCSSAALAVLFCVSALQLRRRSRRWAAARIAGSDVLVTEGTGPAVLGVLRPRIIAPRWLMAARDDLQRAVIAHEQEHLRAHDSRLAAFALFVAIAAPWNAPLWWMLRRLRAAIEIDCDARVLRSGCSASEYAAALLDVAERRSSIPPLAPAMHEASEDLERRLTLLFASPQRASGYAVATLGLLAAGLSVAAAQVDPPVSGAHTPAGEERRREPPLAAPLRRELVSAAMEGDLTSAAALLARGADPNGVVRGDGTPLIVAARRGDEALVDLLLRHGAEPNQAVTGDGNPLIMASAFGHEATVATLIRHGADVNAIVLGDETPLINAARRGHLPIVRILVEHGADVSLATPADAGPFAEVRSPVSEARKYGRKDVLAYLRAHSARE